MLPEKLKLEIENGKINSISPSEKGVEILLDGQSHSFENASILPGFVDSHLHFFGIGEVALMPDFRSCTNEKEMLDRIYQKPFYRGDWLVGFGWNQENFLSREFPKKELFDNAFPDTPVFLKRIDGHSAIVNQKALELIGITENTESPFGGIIHKDENGLLTGLLIDTAMDLAMNLLPFYDENQIRKILNYSQNYLSKLGLTEVIDMDLEPCLIQHLKLFDNEGLLKIRVNSFVKAQNDDYIDFIREPYFGKHFSVRGIKLYADGALGSRGAALKQPYTDKPDESGLLLLTKTEMKEKISNALRVGFSVAIHSIGDKASELVLDAFDEITCSNEIKQIQNKYEVTEEIPFRLEHCQIISENDLPKFANGLIAASVQPIHFTSDTLAGMAQQRIGDGRMRDAYRWKSLNNTNAPFLSGSDAPIESPNPFLGIGAFTSNLRPNEQLTLSEAIDSYTINPQKSLGNHKKRGKIQIGYDADLIVIENCDSISASKILCTIIDGQIV